MRAILGLGVLAAAHGASTRDVIGRVVKLLSDLQDKAEKDCKDQAGAYDKFACWCKDTLADKAHEIKQSDKIISDTDAVMNAAQTKIDAITDEDSETSVPGLEKKIKTDQGEQDDETKAMNTKSEECRDKLGKTKRQIALVGQLIDELRAMQKQVAGNGGQQGLLMQLHELNELSAEHGETIGEAIKWAQSPTGERHAYQSGTKKIMEMMSTLRTTFSGRKRDLEVDCADARMASEKLIQTKQLAIKMHNDEIARMTEEKEKAQAKFADAKSANDAATEVKDAAEKYSTTASGDCTKKAEQWDGRQAECTEELAALAQAHQVVAGWQTKAALVAQAAKVAKPHAALEQDSSDEDVLSDEDTEALADEGLSLDSEDHSMDEELDSDHFDEMEEDESLDLPTNASHHDDFDVEEEYDEDAIAFLQVRKHRHHHHATQAKAVVAFLNKMGKQMQSRNLLALVSAVKADPFHAVKGMISDLIARLKEELQDDMDTADQCKKDMKKGHDDDSAADEKIAVANQDIATANENMKNLKKEMAQLSDDIAQNQKQTAELEKTIAEQDKTNKAALQVAKEGEAMVQTVLELLNNLYGKDDAVAGEDQSTKYGDGPKFGGKQSDGAKGIIGMLEVVEGDFQRDQKKFQDLLDDQSDEEQVTALKSDTSDKKGQVKDKATEHATQLEARYTGQDDLKAGRKDKKAATKFLASIEEMCVAKKIDFAERKRRRDQEIAALKEAMEMLENWDQ